jgi:hypothetical protein
MQNHWGSSARRPRFKTTTRQLALERLEQRCVLSAAPTSNSFAALLMAQDSGYGKSAVPDSHASTKGKSAADNLTNLQSNPASQVNDHFQGHDAVLLGTNYVASTNPGSLSPSEYAKIAGSYSSSRPANSSLMMFVKEYYSDGFTNYYEVITYAVSYGDSPSQGNSHDNSGGKQDLPRNPSSVPIQPTESTQHSESLTAAARLVTTAIAAQPTVGTITSVSTLYHDVVDAVHNTSFGSVDAAVKQAVETLFGNKAQVEAFFDRIAAELSEAGKFAASHSHDTPGLFKVADGASEWPVQKASLAALPLNIEGVQRALEKVMTDLGHLGSAFSTWFTTQHMTEVAAAVSVITVSGGMALYLRRRGGKLGQKRDEEASSSWLFARLNSAPDAT